MDGPLESQPAPHVHLPSACLTHIFSLLTARDLAHASCVSRHWHDVAQSDGLWQPLCQNSFMLDVARSPQGESCDSFHAAFRAWKADAVGSKYEELIPRTAAAIKAIKSWLQDNVPAIHDSLLPGVTEEAINEAQAALGGTPFPAALRVLYRLCNGQDLAFDRDTADARMRHADESCFHGLFGGYTFYQHTISVRMYPLDRMARMTRIARARQIVGNAGILFAASYNLKKLFQVQLNDGSIHVNTTSLDFIRAAPATPQGVNDGILRWLEKYAENLQAGLYEAGPLLHEEDMTQGINLFPASGPDLHVAISRGVEVKASCIMAPEHSYINAIGPQTYMFSYCIRFRLLDIEEQEAVMENEGSTGGSTRQAMRSCQLKSRHWIICDGINRDEVRGEAVIGQYPLLVAGGPAFAYQSCTQQSEHVGWMEGSFTFVEGTLTSPTGPHFEVKCPRFYLKVPDFIF